MQTYDLQPKTGTTAKRGSLPEIAGTTALAAGTLAILANLGFLVAMALTFVAR